jgi:transposase
MLGKFARIDPEGGTVMYSTRGRPRRVTDEQVEIILQWHASRKSMGQLAKELGLSKATVSYVIQMGGRFK